MEINKIGICEPKDFSDKAIDCLRQYAQVELYEDGDIKQFVADKDAIFVRLANQIDDDFIERCTCLKYICSPTTGLNHISISNNGIEIISLKGEKEFLSTIRATPEHIFGLTLSLLRNYSRAFLGESNKDFDRELYKGYELYENTVGIIGLGRVGKILAHYYNAFGAKVYFYDIEDRECVDAERCESIQHLIEKSNILILAANYTPDNDKMIGKSYLEAMKGKYFLNVARGELVDENELILLLEKKWFAGVAIDVIASETKERDILNKLLAAAEYNNLIVTPHIGGATYSSMAKTEIFIAQKLIGRIKNV